MSASNQKMEKEEVKKTVIELLEEDDEFEVNLCAPKNLFLFIIIFIHYHFYSLSLYLMFIIIIIAITIIIIVVIITIFICCQEFESGWNQISTTTAGQTEEKGQLWMDDWDDDDVSDEFSDQLRKQIEKNATSSSNAIAPRS